MKKYLLASLLLLSGCMEETIIISNAHERAIDAMEVEPTVVVHGSLYVDDIIR